MNVKRALMAVREKFVVLREELEQRQAEIKAALPRLLNQQDAAREAVQKQRDYHKRNEGGRCAECGDKWPCQPAEEMDAVLLATPKAEEPEESSL